MTDKKQQDDGRMMTFTFMNLNLISLHWYFLFCSLTPQAVSFFKFILQVKQGLLAKVNDSCSQMIMKQKIESHALQFFATTSIVIIDQWSIGEVNKLP